MTQIKKVSINSKQKQNGTKPLWVRCRLIVLSFFLGTWFWNTNRMDTIDSTVPQQQTLEWEVVPHPALVYANNHPEEGMTLLKIPKVWNPYPKNQPTIRERLGHNGTRLLTMDEAMLVGSHISIQDKQLPTMFVGISSYRDFRCVQTLENLLQRAKYPQRLFIGIVDQIASNEDDIPCQLDCRTSGIEEDVCRHQIRYYSLEASLAAGPVLARHLTQRLYRGEYYVMQTDAHMEFIQHWDVHVIDQWEATHNEMAILTTYASDATPEHIDKDTGISQSTARPYMCDSIYDEDYYDDDINNQGHMKHGQEPEGQPLITGTPMLEPFFAAGFFFSRGHFILQVPYDYYLPMIFQGEEPSIGIRAFTYGYDFYAPEYSIVHHYYDQKSRKPPPLKTNQTEIADFEEQLDQLFQGPIRLEAMNRLKGILHTNPEITSYNTIDQHLYGLGKVRTTQKYFETFGIHPVNHTVEPHLCDFVEKDMHLHFTPHLRHDHMGIDYSQITYQYKKGDYPDHDDDDDDTSSESNQ